MLYLVRVWLRYNYSVWVVGGVCVWFVRFGELTVVCQESRPQERPAPARARRAAATHHPRAACAWTVVVDWSVAVVCSIY